jgi:hypothetical protein
VVPGCEEAGTVGDRECLLTGLLRVALLRTLIPSRRRPGVQQQHELIVSCDMHRCSQLHMGCSSMPVAAGAAWCGQAPKVAMA